MKYYFPKAQNWSDSKKAKGLRRAMRRKAVHGYTAKGCDLVRDGVLLRSVKSTPVHAEFKAVGPYRYVRV